MTEPQPQAPTEPASPVPAVLIYPVGLVAAMRRKFLEDYKGIDVYGLVRAIDEVAEQQGFRFP